MKQNSSKILIFLRQTFRQSLLLGITGLIPALAQSESKITISGISSGGFMASQMATTYSSQISGVGTVAGGFFYCAKNHMQEKIAEGRKNIFLGSRNLFLFEASPKFYGDALIGPVTPFRNQTKDQQQWVTPSVANPTYESVAVCMQNPVLATLPELQEFAQKGLIDSPENLRSQQAYIYQGDLDTVVNPQMGKRMVDFYTANQVPTEQIKKKTLPGGHNFPTDKLNLNDCQNQSMPYVSSCEYNLAEDMLQHLLKRKLSRSETPSLENLYRIDQNLQPQNENLPQKDWKSPAPSLAAYGYLYAGQACLENPSNCDVHVALHGCEMSDSYDPDLDKKFQQQVKRSQILTMIESKKLGFYWPLSRPSNDERRLSYGTLKFATLSGYIELAEKNNLMILFPQTWVSAQNYPYNPKGCWDWFGATGPDYATNKGVETSWLIQYIKKIQTNPTDYILSLKPEIEKISN